MPKYSDLNPYSISFLSDKELRSTYSELRSIARKRADRLEAAGFQARRFPALAKLGADEIADQLSELAYYLRSPGSQVKFAREEREQATLAAHGYDIQDYRAFGQFMDNMRYRYKNRKLPDSGLWADIYKQAERRKMSVRTLQWEFGAYLNETEDAERLRDALEAAPVRTKGRDRLTARNLRSILEK